MGIKKKGGGVEELGEGGEDDKQPVVETPTTISNQTDRDLSHIRHHHSATPPPPIPHQLIT
jgi:hypothetical protein